MPYCDQCGYKIIENAKFCSECGTPISDLSSKYDSYEPDLTIIRQGMQSYSEIDINNLKPGYLVDGRYKIESKLGRGGFGVVYKTCDQKLDSVKAVKIIFNSITNDYSSLEILRKEARLMVNLNHSNIVRIFDFHDVDNLKYLDMEYVDGQDLDQLRHSNDQKKLKEKEVRDIALQIAQGMEYAHSRGIIHRDLKPQNIILTMNGQVKIMDFGLAESLSCCASCLADVSKSETSPYMSPEKLRGKCFGPESDIYSFAITIYELLCGHPPFYKGSIDYQILNEEPEKITGISEKMNSFLFKCLEKDYMKRYRSFYEVLSELRIDISDSKLKNISESADNIKDIKEKEEKEKRIRDEKLKKLVGNKLISTDVASFENKTNNLYQEKKNKSESIFLMVFFNFSIKKVSALNSKSCQPAPIVTMN